MEILTDVKNKIKENDINDSNENSFETMSLYRSIYIIKRKFEIYDIQIKDIYNKYNINEFDNNLGINFYIINIDKFELILNEIFENINCLIFEIHHPKDIFISNLYRTEEKKKEMRVVFQKIQNYLFENNHIEKYNKIFYIRKIKPLLLIKNKENSINNEEEEINKPIVEYNNNGKIIKSSEQINEENLDFNENKEIIDKYLPQNNNLYIESLILIISDFLQKFPNYKIIEINNDLSKELNILFDKDILEKINLINNKNDMLFKLNPSKEKELNKCLKQKQSLNQNIKLYEKILLEKKNNKENGIIIQDMIEKLLAKKIWLNHKIKYLKEPELIDEEFFINKEIELNLKTKLDIPKNNFQNLKNSINDINYYNNSINKIRLSQEKNQSNQNTNNNTNLNSNNNSNNTINNNSHSNISLNNNFKTENPILKEEIRLISLKEIFEFYSNQHNYVISGNGLFSAIDDKKSLLNLSEFSKFCSEFSINISRQKLVEIYKKNSSNLYNLNFKEFLIALENLCFAFHENKKNILLKKISHYEEKLNLCEKNHKNNNKENSVFLNVKYEISSFKFEYEKLVKQSYKEILENFYDYLGIYQKKIYRNKMKGFILPYNSKEKKIKIPKKKIFKFKVEENNEIKKIIETKRKEKEKLLLSQKILQKDLLYKHKLKLFELNNKQLELHSIKRQKEKKYSNKLLDKEIEIQNKILENQIKNENKYLNKISWEKLDEINIEDLNMNENDKQIFEENYNSDDEELINYLNKNKKLIKNYSSIDIHKNKSKLPPIYEKRNFENKYKRIFPRNKSDFGIKLTKNIQ